MFSLSQTSLAQFIALYESSITGADRAATAALRAANIAEHLTAAVHAHVQRGLFERHKLPFALMMTNRVQVGVRVQGAGFKNK